MIEQSLELEIAILLIYCHYQHKILNLTLARFRKFAVDVTVKKV